MYGPRRWIDGAWPYRAVPLPDELLSSYLWRTAEGFGVKPISFLNGVFGSSRSLLNQDLDSFVSALVLARLCEGSGLAPDAIAVMTLAEHVGRLNATHHPRGRKTWILPTTILSNKRLRAGLQYCPACLRSDARPYLRRSWRLGFTTTCTLHGIAMLDRCPHCRAFVQPHSAPCLLDCHACGEGLAAASAERPADARVIARQQTYEDALRDGWAMIGDKPIRSPLYFVVVRRLAALIALGQRAEALRAAIVARHGGDGAPFVREDTRHSLEYLEAAARGRLFGLVDRLLYDWPLGFVETCRSAGVTRSVVIKDMPYVPFALDEVLRLHLDDTSYSASDAEVAAAAAWLRRTRGLATYRDLKAHCGEAREALYRHMNYERQQTRPSWRRSASGALPLV